MKRNFERPTPNIEPTKDWRDSVIR